MSEASADNALLRRVSRSMFWNASMLPVIIVVNLAAGIMLRRGFGLQSGVYDVALGVLNTLLASSELGLPATVHQFVPGIDRTVGRLAVVRFLWRVVPLRLGLLVIVLVPFNLFATELAHQLHLGAGGVWLLHVVSVLAIFRAGTDMAIGALQALLAHFLANLVQLAQAIVLVGAVAWTLSVGGSIPTLFTRLAAAAAAITLGSALLAGRQIGTFHTRPMLPAMTTAPVESSTFWRFAVFMYVFEASNYFTTPAFASPALAAVSGGPVMVALFNVAFQIPLMVVVVILSGFQGLYRPLFAGIFAENSRERIRTAFSEVSKVQAVLLIPAGVGLGLMLPDYVTLLFTDKFAGAVPLARVLCVFLFLEALLNLGNMLLAVDHRYALALTAQALRIVGAPVFVWLAIQGHMFLATTAFGVSRLLAVSLGFFVARRLYGLRFPVAFTARVCLPTTLMGVVVAAGRLAFAHSWLVTPALTLLGAAIAVLGVRWFRVLGAREVDILRRTGLPGRSLILRWLAPEDPALGR